MLARLRLSEDELRCMTDDLCAILAYIDLLSELNTDAVEPMAHAMDLAGVFREDVVQPGLSRESALANAPRRDAECFRVPAVFGDD